MLSGGNSGGQTESGHGMCDFRLSVVEMFSLIAPPLPRSVIDLCGYKFSRSSFD